MNFSLSLLGRARALCGLALVPLVTGHAQPPSPPIPADPSAADGSPGLRPAHLWTPDYLALLWNDTGSIVTAPMRWDEPDWLEAGVAAAAIGTSASLDQSVKDHVQAHRTAGEDRFFKQYENLGSTWSFGIIGAFEVWGEIGGDPEAKNTALDALTASLIGPGLIGTSAKYAVGRVRPTNASRTFEFKPFTSNASFPSGHAAQAFTVATAIAEHYPYWWVQSLCYGGATLVGYARIEQNAHFASDVVAGSLLGWSVARAVVHRHDHQASSSKLSWSPYLSGNGAGLILFQSF